ncbi:MAG: HIT family protein [Candidatus Moranbacteria bacterium]|nr:HIT family protein [Candidatus Moranbacteria bacterium]
MICPFCEIDKEKTRTIKEGEHTLVIFSNPRLMPGHLLVVPRRHVEKLSELFEEERKEMLDFVIEFQDKILEKVARGCDIRQNYRPFQKQNDLKVHHMHIHLQPRELRDELYEKCQIYETELFKKLPDDEIKNNILFF